MLIANMDICLVCGEPLVALNKAASTAVNSYSLEEKQTTNSSYRKIELRLTDAAIENAAPLFGTHLPLSRPNRSTPSPLAPKQTLLPPLIDEDVIPQGRSGELDNLSEVQDTGIASQYFELDAQEGVLSSLQPDYKGKNKKLQQQAFILLYVWAYPQLVNGQGVTREHLIAGAKHAGLYDKNFSSYLEELKNVLAKVNDTYKLNQAGQIQVSQIQADMRKTDLKGYQYWDKPKSKPRSNRTSSKQLQEVNKWVSIDSICANFDVRQLKMPYQVAMFAIYDITKSLKVTDSVKPLVAFNYVKNRYTTISVSQKQFSDSLSSKGNGDKFQRTDDGKYYLTQSAEAIVQGWISKGVVE